jgi:hypothetical protein
MVLEDTASVAKALVSAPVGDRPPKMPTVTPAVPGVLAAYAVRSVATPLKDTWLVSAARDEATLNAVALVKIVLPYSPAFLT